MFSRPLRTCLQFLAASSTTRFEEESPERNMNPAPLLACRDRGSRLLSGLVSNGCPWAGVSIALNRDLVSDLSLAGISHHSHN